MFRSNLRTAIKRRPRPFCRGLATAPSSLIRKLLESKAPVDIHPEVLDGLHANKPVVALETALVTHGFKQPENHALASTLEDIVRSNGSIPATIAILDGRVKIGLNPSELERICQVKATKISRRDIGAAIATRLGGVHRGGENSMDISADLGELARCPVGIVSSGVKSILDIGRTLEYLETLGVPVISYGKTRDFPAFFSPRSGYQVPWNVEDPISAARVLHSQWQLGLSNGALIAVPIPQEYEATGLEIQKAVDQAVRESEQNGVMSSGNDATPWLLKRVGELTQGESLKNNVALLKNTAAVGSQIAVQYENLLREHDGFGGLSPQVSATHVGTYSRTEPQHESSGVETINTQKTQSTELIVLGAAAVDISASGAELSDENLLVHSTIPGRVSVSLGGVARNIAEAASRVLSNESVLLVSPIGNDSFGKLVSEETRKLGLRNDGFIVQDDCRTSTCNMILDAHGNLLTGIADMGITESLDVSKTLESIQNKKPAVIAFDGNLSAVSLAKLVKKCKEEGIKVLFEPTSLMKSARILQSVESTMSGTGIDFITPNLLELTRIYQDAREGPLELFSHSNWWKTLDNFSIGAQFRTDLEHLSRMNASIADSSRGTLSFLVEQGVAQQAINLLPLFQHIIIKCGEKGVVVVMRVSESTSPTSGWLREVSNVQGRCIVSQGSSSERVVICHSPPLPIERVVNVTGAGDSFVGALLASLVKQPLAFTQNPESLAGVVTLAQQAAILTLGSTLAVSPELSKMGIL
ncbi:hypothetical protein D9758_000324 [Tetrapyrgos nigripes]|uniref:Carbohydrate kinase PfkB domain-containing protein n=1 Tax=Tetrapyrgos nigripes TaxID=182062 RepID=A0A8H5H1G2_9AGAR|nr:hypothetical protein D9758_000324 [Tetrapyrgos nigripes]